MIDRIELILKTQNLTPTQFADAIGIQRSSMSHILARRNNPSLDFVMKVLNRFPEINAEWLISGKNQMLNVGMGNPTPPPLQEQKTDIKTPEFEWNGDNVGALHATPLHEPQNETNDNKYEKTPPTNKPNSNQNSDIERIIVFFTDGTFRSYLP